MDSYVASSYTYTAFATLFISLCLSVFYWVFLTDNRLKKHLSLLPGPPQIPILGNTFQLIGPNEEFLPTLCNWSGKYGPRFSFRVGSWWVAVIASAKDMEKLLSSSTEITKSTDYDQLVPWLGTGLLTSNGKKWAHRRKMLTSAFHFKILEQFVDVFNDASKVLVTTLLNDHERGDTFDVVPYITRCTLDIICETAMGLKLNSQQEKDAESEYIKAIHRMGEIQQHRAMRPWLEMDFVWKCTSRGREEENLLKVLHRFTEKVICERKLKFRQEREETQQKLNDNFGVDLQTGKPKKLAFLDLLLEAQENPENQLSDDGIREETDTFMFEGHDTTAASVSFTIFALGFHLNVQEKIHEELNDIFGEDHLRPITMQDLTRMKYLECCIKESLRIFPSVPIIARNIQNDFRLDEDVILPAGTLALIFPYQLHRDVSVFPEPEKYQPERFLPENCVGRHPFAFVPFSGGPRNCIGQKFAMMEEKIVLANFFRNLQVESMEKVENIVLLSSMILRSKHGLSVKIKPRSRT